MSSSQGRILLSTASVYPEPVEVAFELAATLQYDGLEIMLEPDPDLDQLESLRDTSGAPVLALHADCRYEATETDPWIALVKAKQAAERLGAETVVLHPPFRWQRDYVRQFVGGLQQMTSETDVRFAVENMFPLRSRGQHVAPHWDPMGEDVPHFTLDLSHTSVAQTDAMRLRREMGSRLRHVHIADGTGKSLDEHLVPGRGDQPCAELLESLAAEHFDGLVVVEVNTRKCEDRWERESDLAEALAFTRLNLAAPADA